MADKGRLLRELQHRVKNNLQMVTSLVRLQERRSRSAEARRELLAVGRRIETLSLVYEKLYAAGEVERVDLGTYLGELGGSLLRLHAGEAPGVRLRTEAESLVVPLDKAVPLGLIANEFVTNSFKYAFRASPAPSPWSWEGPTPARPACGSGTTVRGCRRTIRPAPASP